MIEDDYGDFRELKERIMFDVKQKLELKKGFVCLLMWQVQPFRLRYE